MTSLRLQFQSVLYIYFFLSPPDHLHSVSFPSTNIHYHKVFLNIRTTIAWQNLTYFPVSDWIP